MDYHQPFRTVLVVGALIILPIMAYHRLKSQATGEKLDRWQEGPFILFTLRPAGVATMLGLLAFMINPSWMAWSSVRLPEWLRWTGVGLGVLAAGLLVWTLRRLGPNLTDTVVTRKAHSLITGGPYRWVRHPFYVAGGLAVPGQFVDRSQLVPVLRRRIGLRPDGRPHANGRRAFGGAFWGLLSSVHGSDGALFATDWRVSNVAPNKALQPTAGGGTYERPRLKPGVMPLGRGTIRIRCGDTSAFQRRWNGSRRVYSAGDLCSVTECRVRLRWSTLVQFITVTNRRAAWRRDPRDLG